MTIDTPPTSTPIDPVVDDEITRFAAAIEEYLAGDLDEDVFRVTRLTQGIYGQRQGGTNQMVRVRIPYGAVTPAQLEAFAVIADDFSRGWGHLTTRQNIQFHFVELREVPDVLRILAAVGLTSREACGDTVRNVQGCHLAGACPFEVLDISAWAQATNDYLLRNPLGQRLPRKFKINFSGCATDCGQAMFNDVGVIAVSRLGPTARRNRASACSSPAASARTRSRRRRSRSSRAGRTCSRPSRRSCAPSTTTATGTTSCGRA